MVFVRGNSFKGCEGPLSPLWDEGVLGGGSVGRGLWCPGCDYLAGLRGAGSWLSSFAVINLS